VTTTRLGRCELPTTVYAFMQAMGLINDHTEQCVIRRCLNFTPLD